MADRPNLVIILCDDMGYSDLGCYGGEIRTPHLDALARDGMRFSQFYNAARCCPTRASLLTGLYPHQAGMGGMIRRESSLEPHPYQGYLNERCVTIAEVLRAAGYRTGHAGKWHVGEFAPHWPTHRGFDFYAGLISGAANYFDPRKCKDPEIKRILLRQDQPFVPPEEGFYMTDWISDCAVEFLAQPETRGSPFLLYVGYTAPHWPLHALPEDIARYEERYTAGWTALREERYPRTIELGLIDPRWRLSPQDAGAADWSALSDDERRLMIRKMAVYAAQIDRMDQGIGRILAQLAANGQRENTLVLFLSDNGCCAEGGPLGFDVRNNGLPPGGVDSYMSCGRSWSNASNTPFRFHKQWTHEGGIATPLIACWPAAVAPGAITHQMGHVIDLMATACDLAGTEYPAEFDGRRILPLEGRSLLPVLRGRKREGHEALIWEHTGNGAIRAGDWKLVHAKDEAWELYDMAADRTETRNLAADQPQRVKELFERYRAWAARVGAPVPEALPG